MTADVEKQVVSDTDPAVPPVLGYRDGRETPSDSRRKMAREEALEEAFRLAQERTVDEADDEDSTQAGAAPEARPGR